MTTAYEIPFSPKSQTFIIALAGTDYRLTTHWCDPSSLWIVDFATPEGTQILSGVPLCAGIDILGQYAYLNFGGKIFVQSAVDVYASPSYEDLGVNGLVFFVVEP